MKHEFNQDRLTFLRTKGCGVIVDNIEKFVQIADAIGIKYKFKNLTSKIIGKTYFLSPESKWVDYNPYSQHVPIYPTSWFCVQEKKLTGLASELEEFERDNPCLFLGKFLGYICPTDLFDGGIPKGMLYNKSVDDCRYIPGLGTDRSAYFHSLPAEIVEKWDKKYEPKESKVYNSIIIDDWCNKLQVAYSNKSVEIYCEKKVKVSITELQRIIDLAKKIEV